MHDHALVDLADRLSWPSSVATRLEEVASSFSNGPELWATDLKYGDDFGLEAEIRTLLGNRHLAFYHATRLLSIEVDRIRTEGLRLLTDDLRLAKLQAIQDAGLASRDEAALLERSGPLTWGTGRRLNQISVVAPISIFVGDPGGFTRLFHDWGGESISWAAHEIGRPDTNADRRRCRMILDRVNQQSMPAVVEVGIPASELPQFQLLWPIMVGGMIGARNPWNAFHVATPAHSVADVIRPGDPRWRGEWFPPQSATP